MRQIWSFPPTTVPRDGQHSPGTGPHLLQGGLLPVSKPGDAQRLHRHSAHHSVWGADQPGLERGRTPRTTTLKGGEKRNKQTPFFAGKGY